MHTLYEHGAVPDSPVWYANTMDAWCKMDYGVRVWVGAEVFKARGLGVEGFSLKAQGRGLGLWIWC